jgi:hypothetical protein
MNGVSGPSLFYCVSFEERRMIAVGFIVHAQKLLS